MPQIYGKTYNGSLPSAVADGSQGQVRVGRYGEIVNLPIGSGVYSVAMEGSYFKATNPTFGTAFAPSVAAATAFSETQASFIIRNTATAGGKDIYLDFIRFWYVTAPTASTLLECVVQIDNSNRTGSGGSTPVTSNMNSNASNTSVAAVTVGAITAGAAVASRKLGQWRLKSAIPAVADEFMLNFGSVDFGAAAPGVAKSICPGPVYLPAGSNHSCLVHLYGTSQSAAGTVHMDMAWWER